MLSVTKQKVFQWLQNLEIFFEERHNKKFKNPWVRY